MRQSLQVKMEAQHMVVAKLEKRLHIVPHSLISFGFHRLKSYFVGNNVINRKSGLIGRIMGCLNSSCLFACEFSNVMSTDEGFCLSGQQCELSGDPPQGAAGLMDGRHHGGVLPGLLAALRSGSSGCNLWTS